MVRWLLFVYGVILLVGMTQHQNTHNNTRGIHKTYFLVSIVSLFALLLLVLIYSVLNPLSPVNQLRHRLPPELVADLSIRYDSGYQFILAGEDHFGIVAGQVSPRRLEQIRTSGLPIACQGTCQRNVDYSSTKSMRISLIIPPPTDVQHIINSAMHDQSRCTARQIRDRVTDQWEDIFCVSLRTGAFFHSYYVW